MVQVVFRHGARTPLTSRYWEGHTWNECGELFQGVPIKLLGSGGPRPWNASDEKQAATILPGGCSKGALTLVGQRQALEFGLWLRQHYIEQLKLLPRQFEAGSIACRSTNFRRTIATMRGVLTGIYPAHTSAPIPVTASSDVDEILVGNTQDCTRLRAFVEATKRMLRRKQQEEAVTGGRTSYERRIREALGVPPGEGIAWMEAQDAMSALACHGKRLPAGMTDELLQKINERASRGIRMVTTEVPGAPEHAPELLRLSLGRLMFAMQEHMEEAVGRLRMRAGCGEPCSQGKGMQAVTPSEAYHDLPAGTLQPDFPVMHLYCGHDTTVVPLLAALGIQEATWPPFLSHVILELWRYRNTAPCEDEYYVRVLHNREEVTLPGLAPGEVYSLEEFRDRVVGPYRLTSEERFEACQVTFKHDDPMPEPAQAGQIDSVQDSI